MRMEEVFELIEKIGCLAFSTLDEGTIHTRIARFFAHDPEGLYFLTMVTKPFYRQLTKRGKLAVCGIYPSGAVECKDEHGMPLMQPGYSLRITGDVREVGFEAARKKADEGHKGFQFAVYDISRYPAIRIFCLHRGKGEVFDYDFEMRERDFKLKRERFSFGGESYNEAGCRISEDCTGCGACMDACSFKAIEAGSPYRIIGERCDECGNCILACPEGAIREPETI